MATASTAEARKSIARPEKDIQTDANAVLVPAPSRREFLYYIWGASLALMLGEVGAGILWFAFPRFKEGEFGGVFPFNPEDVPPTGTAPQSVPSGRFHVTHTPGGLFALYGVCTHLGCLPKWVPTNGRFECPCHGSKFNLNGTYIEGPAPRGLDRFFTQVVYSDGTTAETPPDGGPIPLDSTKTIAEIRVNTGRKVSGLPAGLTEY